MEQNTELNELLRIYSQTKVTKKTFDFFFHLSFLWILAVAKQSLIPFLSQKFHESF